MTAPLEATAVAADPGPGPPSGTGSAASGAASQEAVIQSLVTQADRYGKTVSDLAEMLWTATRRCGECRSDPVKFCDPCAEARRTALSAGFRP